MLTTLLSLPTVIAFDVGRRRPLLVGYDGSGIRQLHEVGPDGSWRALTELGDTVRDARYIPGARQAVIEHDGGGNERGQLSLLDLEADGLPDEPLVHDLAYVHHLVDAKPSRVLFTTNRRNNVDFDLVARDLASGADTVLYDGGGYLASASASPDDRLVLTSCLGEETGQLAPTATGRGCHRHRDRADGPTTRSTRSPPVLAAGLVRLSSSPPTPTETARVRRYNLRDG